LARRRRRKQVTYDSKETRTVLGLLAILLSIVLYISAFVDANDVNFFTEVRGLFGQTTLVTGFFFMNLGLYLFDSTLPFASRTSVIAQFILVFLLPAFITSLHPSKFDARIATSAGLSGGRIGYFLSYQLFSDSLVFAQYTPLVLGIATAIFAPIALSMSINKLLEYLGLTLTWLWQGLKNLFAYREKVQDQLEKMDLPEKAAMLGDFNRLEAKRMREKDMHDDHRNEPEINPARRAKIDVAISEAQVGEEGVAYQQLNHPNWELPPVSLLSPYRKTQPVDADKERNAKIIEQTLMSFGIDAKVDETYIGPSVVQYALNIPMGVKVAKVATLSENLALALGVDSQAVRIESIPGTTYLGIEVPRTKRDTVHIRELLESEEFMRGKFHLPVTVGKDVDGKTIVYDIQKMPHLLIAGATGSGKSVLTNSFIVDLLMRKTPDELKLILVDPKKVELSDYNGIPHLLTPVITDMDKVVNALKWSVTEMDRRYNTLQAAKVRDIVSYNEKMGFAAMPYIIIVIDEMADMMMTSNRVEAETAIVRLAQKARAVGIHLILATQRPSVNVITGIIKANIPARIGMSVTSSVDSRVILDAGGAESLMGKGDLLFKAPDKTKANRLQSPVVSQEEVERVVTFIKSQVPEVEYLTSILDPVAVPGINAETGDFSEDDLFAQSVRVAVNYQKGSSSFLQRKLNIGFNRAARLLEEMEEAGVVGPAQGSKPREVLISDAEEFLNSLKSQAQ
jgi:DNA segregation ATPase FtsK/SpoIIIE, S-DNA-T family